MAFKLTKWLKRKKVSPINVVKGDSITLHYEDKMLAHQVIDEAMVVDEVGIFKAKVDDRKAIGGVFIEKKK